MSFSTQPPYTSMTGGMPGMPGGMPGQVPQPAPDADKKKGKDGKPPTKRIVSRQFLFSAAFAVAAAAAIWVGINGTGTPSTFVVVAKDAIPTNTIVDKSLLKAVAMPSDLIQPGAVKAASGDAALTQAMTALANVRSQFPITANEQVIPGQFGVAVNLGTPLGADERLVSFRASVASSVAGSIQPGDHVDVYAAAGDAAGPIVFDVPVVSVTVSEDRYNSVADAQAGNKNARPQDLLPGDPVPGTYVVRVKADQVGKIIASDAGGKIYLVYRGAGATDVTTGPTSAKDAVCGGNVALAACR